MPPESLLPSTSCLLPFCLLALLASSRVRARSIRFISCQTRQQRLLLP